SWHVTAGWVAAILIVFRVVWGFVGGEHARFAQFLKPWQIGHHLTSLTSSVRDRSVGHNPLGGIAVIALLTVVASVIYSGVRTNGDAGEGLHEAFAN
ncbi:cytochrome b/b6 domain-containing protein, partial [Enterococcus faecalis]|uniref:cytochrome b/b6 domain-containing protein n=1 Tax=Enterococcus faecalis TaxID=1351 RepID=UPI00403F58EE